MNVEKVLQNSEQCKAHTWLSPAAFAYLLEIFKIEYDIFLNERHKERHWKERRRKKWWGNPWKLDTYEKKLFFILYYLKNYQTYEVLWGAFNMKRARAYRRVEATLEPLILSLKKTVWFLHTHRQNWIESWKNIQSSKMFSLMSQKELTKEINLIKNKRKSSPEKRNNIR